MKAYIQLQPYNEVLGCNSSAKWIDRNEYNSITNEQYKKLVYRTCISYGRHKVRTNNYGVTWCTICGRLFSNSHAELKEEDKLYIKN